MPRPDSPFGRRASLGRSFAFLCLLVFAAGCAHRRAATAPNFPPPPSPSPAPPAPTTAPPAELAPMVPGQWTEQGIASWYGIPFHGQRTSSGEIYDMYQLTAAHKTLPLGSVVRVTNLRNGRQVDVRINDRGPFVPGRVIDLSLAAARAIDMIGAGTALVRIDLLTPRGPVVAGARSPTPPPPSPEGFFAVQVGAFEQEENAERVKSQLELQFHPVSVVPYDSPGGVLYRVRVGRVPSPDAAAALAGQLHEQGFTAFVVRLDN